MIRLSTLIACAALLVACGSAGSRLDSSTASVVTARAETAPVGTAAADAADDPAIWRNPADPAASLIVGTDKKAGLYVYNLNGRQRWFTAAGALNNVDLRADVDWLGRRIILVGASDRSDPDAPRVALFTLDPVSGALMSLGSVATGGEGEAYGFCFGRPGAGMPTAFVITKSGMIQQLAITATPAGPRVQLIGRLSVATQAEGCVVDDRTNQLYVGEEDVGVWRFDLTTDRPVARPFVMVGRAAGLVADVEGLALAPTGERDGLLVVSSQGDNAYSLYQLSTGALVGRFRIGGAGEATSETDGIELVLGDFGDRFPGGLFVAQDGDNAPDAQNFKLVSWADIRASLSRKVN